MANASHRDDDGDFSFDSANLSGRGSPEGEVTATYGSLYRRIDGDVDTTLYVKGGTPGSIDNTGWVPLVTSAGGGISDDQATVNTNLNAAIVSEAATRAAADTSLDTRLDAIEANSWVTESRIGTGAVTQTKIGTAAVSYDKISSFASGTIFGRCQSGVGPAENIYLGSSIELPTGTSQLLRRAALTGDVTAAADSNATTIANSAVTTAKINANAVTNAKLAQVSTATFKGRTTAGTGDPEDLTATQATALLNLATTSVKGLAPVLSNDTTQFLRGDGSYAVPKRSMWVWFGATVVTAGTDNRYLNWPGSSTSPAGSTIAGYPTIAGTIVRCAYRVTTAHTTNTVVIKPRVDGSNIDISFSVAASTAVQVSTVSAAVTAGGTLSCYINHTGATNLANCVVGFEIEY